MQPAPMPAPRPNAAPLAAAPPAQPVPQPAVPPALPPPANPPAGGGPPAPFVAMQAPGPVHRGPQRPVPHTSNVPDAFFFPKVKTQKTEWLEARVQGQAHLVDNQHVCDFHCQSAADPINPTGFYVAVPQNQQVGYPLAVDLLDDQDMAALVAEVSRSLPKMANFIDVLDGWPVYFVLHYDPSMAGHPFWSCTVCDRARRGQQTAIPLQGREDHAAGVNHLYQQYLHLCGRDNPAYNHPIRLEPMTPMDKANICLSYLTQTERKAVCLAHQLSGPMQRAIAEVHTDGQRALFKACHDHTMGAPGVERRRAIQRLAFGYKAVTTVRAALLNLEEAHGCGHPADMPPAHVMEDLTVRVVGLLAPVAPPAPAPIVPPAIPAPAEWSEACRIEGCTVKADFLCATHLAQCMDSVDLPLDIAGETARRLHTVALTALASVQRAVAAHERASAAEQADAAGMWRCVLGHVRTMDNDMEYE